MPLILQEKIITNMVAIFVRFGIELSEKVRVRNEHSLM